MGRGQARVKLGDLISISCGKYSTTYSKENPGPYPYYSSKSHQPDGTCKDYSVDDVEYLILIKNGGSGIGNYSESIGLGKIFYINGKSASSSNNYIFKKKMDKYNLTYLYYYLKSIRNIIMDLAEYTTGMGAITQGSINNLEIPLPPLTEQQTLQSDFDEIRHKHAKIATYKAKAQEAIQRLIPGANTDLGGVVEAVTTVPENTLVVPENTLVTENIPASPLEPTKAKRVIKLKK